MLRYLVFTARVFTFYLICTFLKDHTSFNVCFSNLACGIPHAKYLACEISMLHTELFDHVCISFVLMLNPCITTLIRINAHNASNWIHCSRIILSGLWSKSMWHSVMNVRIWYECQMTRQSKHKVLKLSLCIWIISLSNSN